MPWTIGRINSQSRPAPPLLFQGMWTEAPTSAAYLPREWSACSTASYRTGGPLEPHDLYPCWQTMFTT
eukprot:CAMPEP_0204044276 /NCGR_PEP_ID=MMETSP0360-20130528/104534_1 /ASSEMBLY_ACC=CAM_ASM_000342 /TAXON_ID=268821 /ORGANISM="Scrippsiella Hangoei, Strain SHTV-5" /LENGTH=67 /DNA_ID=CAMNT_0050990721 /DNA_START=29 /DNA_END=229 /DNA_ORIENTATION=+